MDRRIIRSNDTIRFDENREKNIGFLFQQTQSESIDLSVAFEFKSKYLQWIHQTKSLKLVRKLFDR